MNKWLKSVIAGLIFTGLAFFLYAKVFSNNRSYKVEYLIGSTKKLNTKKDLLGETPALIKKRITDMGYRSRVRPTGNNQLDIVVDDVRDTMALYEAIIKQAETRKIEIREIYTLNELPGFFHAADEAADNFFASGKIEKQGIYSIISPLVEEEIDGKSIVPSAIASVSKKDTAILKRILIKAPVIKAIPPDVVFYFGYLTNENQLNNMPDELHLYAIKTRGQQAILQNDDILAANAVNNEIDIKFNGNGTMKLAAMTRNNIHRYIAVILDDIVVMAPRINSEITGGRFFLEGRFNEAEARLTAGQLITNHLPPGFSVLREETSLKNKYDIGSLILILLVIFCTTMGLALFIFNSLNNS